MFGVSVCVVWCGVVCGVALRVRCVFHVEPQYVGVCVRIAHWHRVSVEDWRANAVPLRRAPHSGALLCHAVPVVCDVQSWLDDSELWCVCD